MKDERLKIFAQNLKAERHRRNITQEKLSELVNISEQSISLIERCIQTPSVFVAIDIADAIGIDLKELLRPLPKQK